MKKTQGGFIILEGIIAILIFSFGLLALVALQANATRQTSEARYRMEASLLANQVLGEMWAADKTALEANYKSPSGPFYTAWQDQVAAALPGTATNPPSISFDATGAVEVIVQWQQPGEPAGTPAHNYSASAKIVGNP